MIDEAKIRELVKRQKETGLTITAFCSNEGIPISSFYYWRKKLGYINGDRFIPLLVNSSMDARTKNFIQDPGDQPGKSEDFLLELIYPNGTTLRVKQDIDIDKVRSLVNLFG